MSGVGQRGAAAPAKRNTMRPPPPRPFNRAMSATPTLTGRASPAESMTSNGGTRSATRSPAHQNGTKRKEREFDTELISQETNINVVVRCRGRSDREVKENSGVVVRTDGVKGSTVELSMGPNALSNKTYNFDRVFSPAADQGIVFDEVVAPILDEVVSGFNCTIFAYGQTGTGKTYTMSGDITDMLPLPDDSGIIPRVLHSLFKKLENDGGESSVKCSFIELYNEELRDLLASDDAVKLKIFDDSSRKSHGATLVQGMEETHIKSASKGLELLRLGSHKRQVAATKCNDLSSRSHTVFTMTTYIKRVSETGEDLVSSGKLNLVDLAGSENIQRSGAENKRAAEAGLINKSLLTLGRVINALVEKSNHIPYRESKLTRLLQDSLGGRTKTCIIATLSPAKSNLEETISTLDYAFRAKNIRNKPQVNQLVSKKTLIREFTSEIEKIKSELIATRQRNGVYLTTENYEELTTESESRRILSEEQRDKIETMESNLRNKTQELFTLTSDLTLLKRDNDATKAALDGTKSVLDQTEIVLNHTKQNLAEEELLRRAHEEAEERLAGVGQTLISTLGRTTTDIGGLHAKHRRRSDLQSMNRSTWASSQAQVAEVTQQVEENMLNFKKRHEEMVTQLSARMHEFVDDELTKLGESKTFLEGKTSAFNQSEREVHAQTSRSRDDMNGVLEGITTLRQQVKEEVGNGLSSLSTAAQRISAGVIEELEGFHTQLHQSYSGLGKDFKTTFDDLLKQMSSQQNEINRLQAELAEAGNTLVTANEITSSSIDTAIAEERAQSASDRADLVAQMTSLVQDFGNLQDQRLDAKATALREEIASANRSFNTRCTDNRGAMQAWTSKERELHSSIQKSRESVKRRIKTDWTNANEQTTSISDTSRSVHEETIRIVDAQMAQMDQQLSALDSIVSQVRTQNSSGHASHMETLETLSETVKQSYSSIAEHISTSTDRTRNFSTDLAARTGVLAATLEPLKQDVHAPLADLRSDILASQLTEYVPTGSTPQKISYSYPRQLPRTDAHDTLLAEFRAQKAGGPPAQHRQSIKELPDLEDGITPSPLPQPLQSPSKAPIFTDAGVKNDMDSPVMSRAQLSARPASSHGDRGLRELDINSVASNDTVPPPKKLHKGIVGDNVGAGAGVGLSQSIGPGSKLQKRGVMSGVAEGRENQILSASVGSGGGTGAGGRILRSRGS